MDMREFMDTMLSAFPNATVEQDNDGQLVIYTNMTCLTSEDNPSIPAGEELVVEMPDLNACTNECNCPRPWVIEVDGEIVASYTSEADRDEDLATGEWVDGAAPAYINE